ncbi:tetratricopeptide repeat-containing sensor histidine kinase [Adhaeribacter radiodurans]|uniref:Tetratricopeptide repeat protein n=1 Tax=Adhaeribacter radiodurans TaxID=2745197 RepID=A0A7L7L4B6_9BACT|nr:tetratricopeptide repeat protein [Adhaeribacter radiodurans]QMU27647.1 tetratricopeptide repeat protein [Adhaeribacter radiodurans]
MLPICTFADIHFTQKPDSNLIKQLLDSGYVMESINPQAALNIYAEANQISKKINYVLGQAKAQHYSGIVYSDRSEYQSALMRYQKAMKLYQQINYKRGIGACYTNMGNLFRYQGKLDSALAYHQFAINFFKQSSQLDGLSMAYGNAGGIFQQMKQFEKANNYFTQAVNAAAQVNDSLSLCRALINKGTALNDLKKYDESVKINIQALKIAELLQDDYGLQLANINFADHYKRKKQYARAIQFGLKGLHYAQKLSTPYDVADIKKRIGDLYLENGNFAKAKTFYLEAIELSEKIKATEISATVYTSLHKLYAATADYKPAYNYQTLAQQYQDSILGEKQLKIINELEVKYQSLQKDKELAQQQLQLEKSRQYVIYSIGAFLIALLVVLLLYLYFNYKGKIYHKQLKAVQQEKEIQVLQALMQGEEKERTRIARDLHDEVAGMLAAAKMHMNSLVLQAQEIIQHKGYHQVVDLLDEASVSVRKTAHNLMPEVLMQHGLDKALCRFCNNISNDKLLVVQYDSWGDIGRFAAEFELSVYRIVQELLNNTIKHAHATEAIVQLSYQGNVLSITIEDYGVGINLNNLSEEGMGMHSLRSRVNALQGKIDVSSDVGQGVSVYLEFDTTECTVESVREEITR